MEQNLKDEIKRIKNSNEVNKEKKIKRLEINKFFIEPKVPEKYLEQLIKNIYSQIGINNLDEDTTLDLGGASYDYEPEENEILDALLPRNISIQILRALLENAASEQGARMSAMDNATRNAGEMIDSLTITYNRSRQAQITKELIEIISGAEAL